MLERLWLETRRKEMLKQIQPLLSALEEYSPHMNRGTNSKRKKSFTKEAHSSFRTSRPASQVSHTPNHFHCVWCLSDTLVSLLHFGALLAQQYLPPRHASSADTEENVLPLASKRRHRPRHPSEILICSNSTQGGLAKDLCCNDKRVIITSSVV